MQKPQFYNIISAKPDQKHRGINDANWIYHRSKGKEGRFDNESPSPYLIPNEWICGHIANFLRLGMPPFALMKESRNTPRMFATLDFSIYRKATNKNPDGKSEQVISAPDDAIPLKCWQNDPWLCTGIVLFDILVANDDRRDQNIAVDDKVNPKRITIHDHCRALFGGMYKEGRKHLTRIGCDFGISGADHCIIDIMDTDRHFPDWYMRIRCIPDWFLKSICEEIVGPEISRADAAQAVTFIKDRIAGIDEIIRLNRKQFPRIKAWEIL